jgi:uncharacterized membrane protein required for colicin V production
LVFVFRFQISRWMKAHYGDYIPAWDRSLGALFNALRGFFLIVVFYQLMIAIIPKETLPDSVTNAQVTPSIEMTAKFLLSLLPDKSATTFPNLQK